MDCKQLPQDIMVEILLKLPVKSLMQCKVLDKSYYELINSQRFMKKHYEISKSHPGMLAFQCQTPTGFSATLLSDAKFSAMLVPDGASHVVTHLTLPQLSNKTVGEIIPFGPFNGIFCLQYTYLDSADELCLWNPATRVVKVLPLPLHQVSSIDDLVMLGFGIVPGTNDYKVVRILTAMDFLAIEDCEPFEAEVYNLSTNSWRVINDTETVPSLISPEFESYLNGVYHWLSLGLYEEAIVCFDMSDDAFWKMELPEDPVDNSAHQLVECNVAVLNDSISYIKEFSLNYSADIRIDIWVMDGYGVEDSWNKRYVIGPGVPPWWFLGDWKEDEVLVGEEDQRLISYNPQARQLVQEFPIRVTPEMFKAFRYVESIFPLSVLEEEE